MTKDKHVVMLIRDRQEDDLLRELAMSMLSLKRSYLFHLGLIKRKRNKNKKKAQGVKSTSAKSVTGNEKTLPEGERGTMSQVPGTNQTNHQEPDITIRQASGTNNLE